MHTPSVQKLYERAYATQVADQPSRAVQVLENKNGVNIPQNENKKSGNTEYSLRITPAI